MRRKSIDELYYSKVSELKTKCKKCGCTKLFTNGQMKLICHNCGNYIFKNDEEEFKYRVKEQLLKKKVG